MNMKQETDRRMPRISIIVPIYKVELYLTRCIDSILNQSYGNYELILVDDGSPDTCPDICNQYSEKDQRIIVIHKKNGGLSDARNAGLAIAKGEFILFVDSDDLLVPNALEILLKCREETNAEIVISTKYHTFSNQIEDIPKEESSGFTVVKPQEAERMIFCHNTRWEAWGTLYHADIFRNERFPVGMLYEDIALIPLLILKAKKVCFVDAKIYYYFIRSGSIMDASKIKVHMDLLSICRNLVKVMESKVEDSCFRNDINSGILMELCSRVELAERNSDINKEFIKASRSFMRKCSRYVICTKAFGMKRKIYYFFESFALGKVWYFFHALKKNTLIKEEK